MVISRQKNKFYRLWNRDEAGCRSCGSSQLIALLCFLDLYIYTKKISKIKTVELGDHQLGSSQLFSESCSSQQKKMRREINSETDELSEKQRFSKLCPLHYWFTVIARSCSSKFFPMSLLPPLYSLQYLHRNRLSLSCQITAWQHREHPWS